MSVLTSTVEDESPIQAHIDRVIQHKLGQLEQACWEYIRDRMISPSDCTLVYLQGLPWPVAIAASGYEPMRLDLN